MNQEHPNIIVMKELEPDYKANQDNFFAENFIWRFFNPKAANLFTEDFVWHFINPQLPNIHGEYAGLKGFQSFFEKLEIVTGGTFQVEPVSMTAVGDEIVVTHVKDRMKLNNQSLELDAVVAWRIVNGLVIEAWDISSIYTEQLQAI